jgi:hypothetical protein
LSKALTPRYHNSIVQIPPHGGLNCVDDISSAALFLLPAPWPQAVNQKPLAVAQWRLLLDSSDGDLHSVLFPLIAFHRILGSVLLDIIHSCRFKPDSNGMREKRESFKQNADSILNSIASRDPVEAFSITEKFQCIE